ncbi:hypothetical protein LTS18_005366 [Coniosporium uncinatum]|uniref:Uncharacterized protein n=1 Tax=Coniosporium uncinatum TaxID=93489 RepID=A0ACC3D540_9PEZI|nr:hypothetical protein LTS18_005366 [Coniosporium uncinatum]
MRSSALLTFLASLALLSTSLANRTSHALAEIDLVLKADDDLAASLNTTTTTTLPNLSRRGQPGGIYLCKDTLWRGECTWVKTRRLICSNFVGGWLNSISAFGPDPGTRCRVFAGRDCSGLNRVIGYPGVGDLDRERLRLSWNDRIASLWCDF